MKAILFLLLGSVVYLPFAYGQKEISWKDLKPTGTTRIKINRLPLDEIEWPVFSKTALSNNNKKVRLQGYYLEIIGIDLDNPEKEDTVQMLAISKNFTIKICGVPQFEQYEFCVLEGFDRKEIGKKIMLEGTLLLNTNADDHNLIRLKK